MDEPALSFGAVVVGGLMLLAFATVARMFLLWFFKINQMLELLRQIHATQTGVEPTKKKGLITLLLDLKNRSSKSSTS